MQTMTSVKRINRLSISLNVVMGLALVMIISSGMFVAHANSLNNTKCSPIGTHSVLNLSFPTSTEFSGQLFNTDHSPLADITLTFKTDPNNNNALIQADFTDTPVKGAPAVGLGAPITLGDGDLDLNGQGKTLSDFIVDTNDPNDQGNVVTIDFSGTGTSQKLGGHYEIKDTLGDQTYNGFSGSWLVTASNNS